MPRSRDRLQKKKIILAVISLSVLALVACGRKGNPRPKSLPTPATINDLRGDVKDGVLFLSFTVPTKNRDGTPTTNVAGFQFLKNAVRAAGRSSRGRTCALRTDRGTR